MIRKFSQTDLDQVIDAWLLAGKDEYTYLPDFQTLTPQKAKTIFAESIQSECNIWVAELDDEIAGYMAINKSFIDRLYIRPANQRTGIGRLFIEYAKAISPSGLELYTHQQNLRARDFYEKYGFVAVEFGISPPPESMPDVKYQWRSK